MSCPLPVFIGDVTLAEDTTFTVTVEDPADGVTSASLPSSFRRLPPYYSGFWDVTVASAVTVNAIQFKPHLQPRQPGTFTCAPGPRRATKVARPAGP